MPEIEAHHGTNSASAPRKGSHLSQLWRRQTTLALRPTGRCCTPEGKDRSKDNKQDCSGRSEILTEQLESDAQMLSVDKEVKHPHNPHVMSSLHET